MPAQQIASEQTLVKVPRTNSDIRHIHLQGGSQLKGHAGHTYYLDRSSVGARDILGRLFLNGQPVGVRPLLGQQSDGRSGVNHQEALSGLALGLVTPRDLPRSNADGDVWLVPWLLLGFGWLRAWLSRLEPSRWHAYLLDDEGVGRLGQDARRIGFWGSWRGGWRRDDRRSHHMEDVVFNLLGHGHDGVAGSRRRIVHRLLLIFHCLPGSFAREPLGETSHRRGELVQPGL